MSRAPSPDQRERGDLGALLRRVERIFRWPQRATVRARSAALVIAILVIGGLAWIVADSVWRDELPRSTIAAIALATTALIAFWLFGASGWKTALAILSAVGAILLAAGTALDLDQKLPAGPPPVGALVDCPDFPQGALGSGYTAENPIPWIQLRALPRLDSKILLRYPPNCRLGFDRYCIGDAKDDWHFDVPDPIWFSVKDTAGYVARAGIRTGHQAPRLPRVDCEGGRPGPLRPEITAPLQRRLAGPVEIAAAAPRALEVGFAVYYPDRVGDPGSGAWHQIGIDLDTRDGITANWDSRSVPGQGERRPAWATVLAVPCLGLDFPAKRADRRSYLVANGGGPTPARTHPAHESIPHGRRAACHNIER